MTATHLPHDTTELTAVDPAATLVSDRKLNQPAGELYTGDLFRAARLLGRS